MACDTFLKITIKCKAQICHHASSPRTRAVRGGVVERFNEQFASCDLEPHQVHIFYEAVGHMVSRTELGEKRGIRAEIDDAVNETWNLIMTHRQSSESLKSQEVIKNILNILKTNTHCCISLGQPFQNQMSLIYGDLLNVVGYKLYRS